ncbi:MAG: hydroxyacid dehydrogenase [Candidatus Marsarchaeota archaeon]|nr:hydroxyacid dehydrogenase [Candidatus Marsarchaeota archaeon]
MPTIAICDRLPDEAVSKLSAKYSVQDLSGRTRDEVLRLLGDTKCVIVRSRTRVDKEFMDAAPMLRLVGRPGSGLDNVDLESALKRGIRVVNTPTATTTSVAEYTVGLIIGSLRRICTANQSMRSGKWIKNQLIGRELKGKRVGVLGCGSIGLEVSRLLTAFGAEVVCWSRRGPEAVPKDCVYAELEQLLASCDVVTIHLNLDKTTAGLINTQRISLMRTNSVLVNTSRGEIVDEDALYESLKAGRLGFAALDVFSKEPYQGRLTELENVILTPHVAGNTSEAQLRAALELVDALSNLLAEES